MKVTKEQAARNRQSLVAAASKLFRERGIDGVGVADVSKAAGLTHGALYAQFSSKEELAAEALARGAEEMTARRRSEAGPDAKLSDYLKIYLSKSHRDRLATGCPVAASGSEAARQDKAVSRSFARAFETLVEELEETLDDDPVSARERAVAMAAAEIGAIIVARGVAKADARLSEKVLTATRHVLGELDATSTTTTASRNAKRKSGPG